MDGAVDKPLVWLRYIDDVFFIWTHGQSRLDSFLEYLNGFHQTIKFTSESSMEKVSFLDVMVVKKGGVLETDLYCKPTDTHQYLHRGSCHPWHVKKAIPYGQALRIRRICSDDGKFLARSKELVGWFKDRGYDEGFVKEQVERVRNLDRQVLIEQDVGRNRGRGDRIPFVVSYHPALNGIRRAVGKLQPMLAVTEEHKRVFPEQPLVAFRRASNLKDSLVRARLPPVEGGSVKGCFPCGCKVCGMQYVGSTFTPFRNRFNNYKSSCRKFEKGEMVGQADFYRHFELAGHHGFMEDVGVQMQYKGVQLVQGWLVTGQKNDGKGGPPIDEWTARDIEDCEVNLQSLVSDLLTSLKTRLLEVTPLQKTLIAMDIDSIVSLVPGRRNEKGIVKIHEAALEKFGDVEFEKFYKYICSQKHIVKLADSKDIITEPALSHAAHRKLKNVLKDIIWNPKQLDLLMTCLLVVSGDKLVPLCKAFDKEKETRVESFKDSIGQQQARFQKSGLIGKNKRSSKEGFREGKVVEEKEKGAKEIERRQ
eukprot:gene18386-20236_t